MIYEQFLEIVFCVSFIAAFFTGITLFGHLTGSGGPKKGDFNSPKYLGGLLLGFLGGVIAVTVLAFLSETGGSGGLSWLWPYLALENATGTMIIAAIVYVLLKGARELQNPAL